MTLAGVIFNRHHEVRSGWKLVVFAVLAVLVYLGVTVPLVMVGVFGTSNAPESQVPINLLAILSVLLVSWFMTHTFHRKPLTAIGLTFHPATLNELGIGCLIGFLMMTGVVIVERALGAFEWHWRELGAGGIAWTVVASAASFMVAAALEELIFRGYPFQVMIQGITFLPATLLCAAIFGVSHLENPHASTLGVVNTVLIGILFAVAYMKTRGLWLPLGIHFAWNFCQTTVYGLPTSGVSFNGFRIVTAVMSGPEWITGGAYGPEAGVLTTIAVVAALWYILKAHSIKAPDGIVTLDSIEDLFPPLQEIAKDEGASQ